MVDAYDLEALEFVDACDGYNEVDELMTRFSQVVAGFGFNHFIMTGLPSRGEDVEDLIIAERWPEGWRDRYREESYFLKDPVSKWSFTCSAPFLWHDARKASAKTDITCQIETEAESYGLVDGVGFPMFDPFNWQAVVSLGSDAACDLPKRQIGLVYLASVYCQMRAAELTNLLSPNKSSLTVREAEVLKWVASGKSYWETSRILGIGEATVQTHLSHVRQKLGVANTTEAVAKAIISRQIRL